MFDPIQLCCSSLTTAVGGTKDTNIVDSESPYRGTNHQESLRLYVQRLNTEPLKVDILDEKFTVTAFIAGLGAQSKDLMFSISNNPQASMAEVLAKTEKYINGEEALLSKQRISSTQKEKSRGDKKRERSPKRQTNRDRSPRRSRENRERSLIRQENVRNRRGPP